MVDNGALNFTIGKSRSPGLTSLFCDSELLHPHAQAGPYMVDHEGTMYLGSREEQPQVQVESAGPIKAQISVSGWHVSDEGKRLGRYVLRYTAYRGLPLVQVDHTFIITADSDKVQYRDIGYALPVAARQGFFGAPRITPYKLEQLGDWACLIQLDDYRGKIMQGDAFVDEFSRGEGWFNAGPVTFSVRDFWQNFPKEFEAQPDLAIVHLWPGHGEPRLRTGRHLSRRNAYQLPFAHEGELLDFRIPDEFLDLIDRDGYRQDAQRVNAMGVAKTHQMLLHAGTANWELSRSRSVARVFQSNPTVICDPRWVCESKVFGDIGPRDPASQPQLERVVDGTMSAIARQNEENRDFGMWVFGDTTHFWDWNDRRPVLSRTYRQGHHNWPRWPWLQYARGGSKAVFDYACRNGRNLADVTHCHHTDEQFAAAAYPRQKAVGGANDYKGFAKWSGGERLDYNSVADAMLAHYYFTGDRRALDTAIEHGQAILAENRAPDTREGSGRLCSLVAYYAHTWNNDVLELIERHIDNYVLAQDDNGIIPAEPVLSFWTAAFVDYSDLTRSKRGQALTLRWADLICRTAPEERLYPNQQLYDMEICSVLASLAQAYVYTGDVKYLRMAKRRADLFADVVYDGEDPRFVGQPGLWEENMPWSWFLTDMPRYAYALRRHSAPVQAADVRPEPKLSTLLRQQVDGQEWWTFHAFLRQAEDRPFHINLRLPAIGHVAEVAAVDGHKAVIQSTAEPDTSGKFEWIRLKVPEDGAYEYAFRLRSKQEYVYVDLPLTGASQGLREVYPVRVGDRSIELLGGEWFYFNWPEAVKELLWQLQGRAINEVQVRDASGAIVARQVWVASNGPMMLRLQSDGQRQGWSIRFRGDQGRGRAMLRNLAPAPVYLSVSPDKWFEPTIAVWRWE
jgi:hypothetical protein